MKLARAILISLLMLALLLPCGALADPVVTGSFQSVMKLLNSSQGDDGSYTQMYNQDSVYIFCGREETYLTLDEAVADLLSNWYPDVEEADFIDDVTIDGFDAKHAQLTLARGEKPSRADLYCLLDDEWLLYVEITYPQEKAEALAPELAGWVSSLMVDEGDIGAGDLLWEEVSMYFEVVHPDVFATLGDLIDWLSPASYSWKAESEGVSLTLSLAGGTVTLLVEGAEEILPGEVNSLPDLPTAANDLSYSLKKLVWTGKDFSFDAPRSFLPGANIQSLFDSFPDAMIQMVSNSQYGFTQCIELFTENPQDASQRVALTYYGADAIIGQVVMETVE